MSGREWALAADDKIGCVLSPTVVGQYFIIVSGEPPFSRFYHMYSAYMHANSSGRLALSSPHIMGLYDAFIGVSEKMFLL